MAPLDLKIAIVGGGISGLIMAIALHKRGFRHVTIYEQAAAFGEVGAGVSFQPNAIQAMKICDPAIYEALRKIESRNLWQSKQSVWFDFYDAVQDRYTFTTYTKLGQCGVHRARFLEELVKLVPAHYQTRFRKQLIRYAKTESGSYVLHFLDGSDDQADMILACDGIKSKVRGYMFGEESQFAKATFTGKYAYRALVDMGEAKSAIGAEKAQNACMHLGPSGHVLTFPVNGGKTMNVVAYKTTDHTWPDYRKFHSVGKRADALRDFAGFGNTVTTIFRDLVPEDLDMWAIFDTWDHPPPTYIQDRVCLVGDAAHASSPHFGAGSAVCIEDVAVMAELLNDPAIKTGQDVAAAFVVFDKVRRGRGRWLVQQSRYLGDCYHWRASGVESDMVKIQHVIDEGNRGFGDVDVEQMCRDARALLPGQADSVLEDNSPSRQTESERMSDYQSDKNGKLPKKYSEMHE